MTKFFCVLYCYVNVLMMDDLQDTTSSIHNKMPKYFLYFGSDNSVCKMPLDLVGRNSNKNFIMRNLKVNNTCRLATSFMPFKFKFNN